MIFVGIVALGNEDQMSGELRLTVERADACENISKVHVVALPRYNNLLTLKARSW